MTTNKDTILSLRADVYETSPPDSQASWKLISPQVLVAICFDSGRQLSRIISLVGQQPIINSCITTTSEFSKSSALFGTWFDERIIKRFGLGFAKESDTDDFAKAFDQAKKIMDNLTIDGDSKEELTFPAATASIEINAYLPPQSQKSSSQFIEVETETLREISSKACSSSCSHVLTGTTSPNENLFCNNVPAEKSLNNNHMALASALCNNKNVCQADASSFMVMQSMTAHEERLETLAKENAYLHQALNDALNNVNKWEIELVMQKKEREVLLKSKEETERLMEEWKNKSYEFQAETKIWKDRCENAELSAQHLSEETVAKCNQQLVEALNTKEYYKSVVQEKEIELRKLKSQFAENGTSHIGGRDLEHLKALQAKTKQQESAAINIANEQWTTMREVEGKMADSIQKLIEIHSDLKQSVKNGVSWKSQLQ